MRAKLPKISKVPRPRVRVLRERMLQLITLSPETRIAALVEVMHWYDDAAAHLLSKNLLDVEQELLLKEAKGSRLQGIETADLAKKESFFKTAIWLYRKACIQLNPPILDFYYEKLDAKRDQLEARAERLNKKYGEVVHHLQSILAGRGLSITITDSRKQVQHDPLMTTLCYNRRAAAVLSQRLHKEGLLSVFLSQLELLSRRFAFVPDGAGGLIYDVERHLKATYELLEAFLKYVRSPQAPKSIVKHGPGRGRKKV